jgi:hypothetical protein
VTGRHGHAWSWSAALPGAAYAVPMLVGGLLAGVPVLAVLAVFALGGGAA